MKKTNIEELVKISLYCTTSHLQPINTSSIKGRIIINLDTINPFEYNDLAGDILLIDFGNINGRVSAKHLAKTFCIVGLPYKVRLFVNRAPKLAVYPPEVNKI